jgi:tartrate-resistant acid phosphatase type 5
MKKYTPFSFLIPFLLYTSFSITSVIALPIDLAAPKYSTTDVRILSVGDWGSASLGGYHLKNAENTANAMKIYASEYNPKLVLNTGDNFYYCGIQNTSDPQVSTDYVELFGNISIPWYNALGNHDYGFNPDAQLELNKTLPNWIMDNRYYHNRVILESGNQNNNDTSIVLNIIVLDTNPCINDYRGKDRAKWDPCGVQFPTCAPAQGECFFHENIIAQDCTSQLSWFNNTLSNISPDEWVFVIGHHKADEINTEDFQTLLDSNRVHLYLNGHNHNLDHYSINDQKKYMTTGAGGMVLIGANGHSNVKLHDDKKPHKKNNAKSIWSKIITGFSSHTFFDDGTTVKTDFWNINQTILYSFNITKN